MTTPTRPSPRTIPVTSDDLFWAVAGAGADTCPWYDVFGFDEAARTIHVDILTDLDSEDPVEVKRATLTVTDLRRAIDGLAAQYPNAIGGYIADECRDGDPDLDAEMADAVIQYAVLGNLVYG